MRVLVIEDSYLIRTLICGLLKSSGIAADHCFDVGLALRLIDSKMPDWLIINPILPYSGGFELLY